MKAILTAAILLLTHIAGAQVQKNVGDFDTVKVFDQISIELVAGNENKVTVSGSRSNEVEIVNKSGDLHIRMPFEKLLQGEHITAVVYYKKLKSITASEGSTVSSAGVVKQPSLEISAKEGAQVRLAVESDNLNIKSVTGAIVNLTGEVSTQNITMGTGGILNAKKLISANANISINAGGEANIYATDIVEATVRAGGEIDVYGRPKELKEKIVLGGTIRRAE